MAWLTRSMTVADSGAGEGYYTVRLARKVGPDGRVLAQDIVAAIRDRLASRVERERLDNVSVKLGEPHDPKLPGNSFDRIFLVNMYHERSEEQTSELQSLMRISYAVFCLKKKKQQ